MDVLILDGELKSALSAVRSLGRAGIAVSVGSTLSTGMAMHSRYTQYAFVYPSPYTDQLGFIDALKTEAIRLGNRPLVYAFSDATYLSLFEYRDSLASYMELVFPAEESVHIAYNKAATYSLARVSQIPTICTYTCDALHEIERVGAEGTFPKVVKPRRSVSWQGGVGVFGSATFAPNIDALRQQFLDVYTRTGEPPLIQQCIYGEEYGVEMLVHDGYPYAMVAHHRLRSLSPTGGASVLKETMEDSELRGTLIAYAQQLALTLKWEGPMMVEFKVDADTREPLLMEVNGRWWGSLPLAVAAGVDMPLLFYDAVRKRRIPERPVMPDQYMATRHFLGDIRYLLRVICARDPMRSRVYPSRVHAIRDFFRIPRGTQSDVWCYTDWKPALMEIITLVKRVWK